MPKQVPNSPSTDIKAKWIDALEKSDTLLDAVRSDTAMNKNDADVCWIILIRLHHRFPEGVVAMSYPEIASESDCLNASQVRRSVTKLVARGYFQVIRPSAREVQVGGWSLKYRPCFEREGTSAAA